MNKEFLTIIRRQPQQLKDIKTLNFLEKHGVQDKISRVSVTGVV